MIFTRMVYLGRKIILIMVDSNKTSYFCNKVNHKSMQYNRIKEVLAAKGIKQVWLAEQLGKSFRTVNTYVTNTVQPPIPVLYKIAEILHVQPTDLLVNDPSKED